MAVLSFTDAEILAGPLRMTGRTNQVDLELEAVKLDVTNFGSGGWEESIGGLRSVMAKVAGQYDAGPVETGALNFDGQLFGELGGSQIPLTVAPAQADGSVAYIAPVRRGNLAVLGAVGDVAPYGSDMWGDGAVARGALIHPANVLRTAGGTGTAAQLGTVATGRQLLVAIHVLTVTGTTPALTITVQRDDNGGFTTPTTVTTLGPTAVPTSALTAVAGPITPDDRYRITWTLTGTTPSARFAVAVGITPQ
jgi:hypothetical protein